MHKTQLNEAQRLQIMRTVITLTRLMRESIEPLINDNTQDELLLNTLSACISFMEKKPNIKNIDTKETSKTIKKLYNQLKND